MRPRPARTRTRRLSQYAMRTVVVVQRDEQRDPSSRATCETMRRLSSIKRVERGGGRAAALMRDASPRWDKLSSERAARGPGISTRDELSILIASSRARQVGEEARHRRRSAAWSLIARRLDDLARLCAQFTRYEQ